MVLKAIRISKGYALEFASHELKNDREIVLEAVKFAQGCALKYASKELRGDMDIILEALRKDRVAIQYADLTKVAKGSWCTDNPKLFCGILSLVGCHLPSKKQKLEGLFEVARENPDLIGN
jgi:hypothetical protein